MIRFTKFYFYVQELIHAVLAEDTKKLEEFLQIHHGYCINTRFRVNNLMYSLLRLEKCFVRNAENRNYWSAETNVIFIKV